MENSIIGHVPGFFMFYEIFIPASVGCPNNDVDSICPLYKKEVTDEGCLMGISFFSIVVMLTAHGDSHAYIRNHLIKPNDNWIFSEPDIPVCTCNPRDIYKPRFCQYAGEQSEDCPV